jgi:hypothetical protein
MLVGEIFEGVVKSGGGNEKRCQNCGNAQNKYNVRFFHFKQRELLVCSVFNFKLHVVLFGSLFVLPHLESLIVDKKQEYYYQSIDKPIRKVFFTGKIG